MLTPWRITLHLLGSFQPVNHVSSLRGCLRRAGCGLARDANRSFRRARTPYTARGQFFRNFQAICVKISFAKEKHDPPSPPPTPTWLFGFASAYFLPPRIDRSVPIIRAASFKSLFFLRGLSACAESAKGRLNFAAANNGSGIIQNTVTFPPARSGGYKFDPNGL